VSYKFLGNKVLLKPRACESLPEFSIHSEPVICVSPTIAGCLMGIPERKRYPAQVYVYRCKSYNAKPRSKVYDFDLTQEHNLFEPTEFKYVLSLPSKIVKDIHKFVHSDLWNELPSKSKESISKDLARTVNIWVLDEKGKI
jgi:hypothetical protein